MTIPVLLPQQYTTADGTIRGAIDGLNAVFTLGVFVPAATIFRNGQQMTQDFDCTFSGRTIVFLGSQIPQPGDIITAFA